MVHRHPEIRWETSIRHTATTVDHHDLAVHETGVGTRQKQHLITHINWLRQLETRSVGLHGVVVAEKRGGVCFHGKHLEVLLRGQRLMVGILRSSRIYVDLVERLCPGSPFIGCLDTTRRHCIDPHSIVGVLKSRAPHKHVQLSHDHVKRRMSWPGLLSGRCREDSDRASGHPDEGDTGRHYLHGGPHVDFILSIVVLNRPLLVNAAHMPDGSVAEEDGI